MFSKILFWLFFLKVKTVTCIPEKNHIGIAKQHSKAIKINVLSKAISELSGLSQSPNKGNFLAHNDGGNKPEIFEIDSNGNIIKTITIPTAQNIDWEDITQDHAGHIFIGDFGNNTQLRKNYSIYKYNFYNNTTDTIQYQYEDYPVNNEPITKKDFDCEAFFYYANKLYLFSKNRTSKQVKLYQLPSNKGSYTAKIIDNTYLKTQITAADIQPKGNIFALCSYGKIFIFGIQNQSINFRQPLFCIKSPLKQAEALVFETDSTLLVGNEQQELYKIKIKLPQK
jgi:hypothetical protein